MKSSTSPFVRHTSWSRARQRSISSRKSGPRWWMTGSAPAARTSGGTGVGPGAIRYRFPAIALSLAPDAEVVSGAVDALLAFAAALVSLRLSAELARRYWKRRAPELLAWAAALARLRRGRGRARVGRSGRLGRGRLPRLLPRRRAPHRGAAGSGLAAPRRTALGRAGGARLLRDRGRRRPRGAARSPAFGNGRPGRPGRARAVAGPGARDRGEFARNARRRRRRRRDDPPAPARERAAARGGRRRGRSEARSAAWASPRSRRSWRWPRSSSTPASSCLRPRRDP